MKGSLKLCYLKKKQSAKGAQNNRQAVLDFLLLFISFFSLSDALEKLWLSNPKLDCEIIDVLLRFFNDRFSCYETYLVQQSKQAAFLKTL